MTIDLENSESMEERRLLMAAFRRSGLALYALGLVFAAVFSGWQAVFSVGLGGALAMINLALLEAGLAVAVRPGSEAAPAAALAMGSFYVRLMTTGGVILAFILAGWVNVPALMAGLAIPLAGAAGYFLMVRPILDWYERAY